MITKKDYQKLEILAKRTTSEKLDIHIHLDFKTAPLPEDLMMLYSRGILPTPFIQYDHLRPERPSLEPLDPTGMGIPYHFTKQSPNPAGIHADVLYLDEHFLSKTSGRLYMEVELAHRLSLNDPGYDSHSSELPGSKQFLPIKFIETESIIPGNGIWFRDSELHVYANQTVAVRTENGRQALNAIVDLGLYEAYYNGKFYGMEGVGVVFTIQGTRDLIFEIQQRLLPFLSTLKNATPAIIGVEREDIIGFCLCNMGPNELPPLAKIVH